MFLGYNTNGFSYHRLDDAIEILADIGYRGIGLTLDVHHLDPDNSSPADGRRIHQLLQDRNLKCVIETGSRFLLDKRSKHQPTLLSSTGEERGRRNTFLAQSIGVGLELNADTVSFWSGTPIETESDEVLLDRLVEECRSLCTMAERTSLPLAFEPEPGMFIDTMEKFAELHCRVDHPRFGLTLDVGHLVCMGEPIRETIIEWKDWLWNVHLDDMKVGVHDHLMFGEGDVNFVEVFDALRDIDYQYGAYVELSRHAHDAVRTAEKSLDFLKIYWK